MKISLDWLKDFLPGETAAAEAAEILTHGGFPVEAVEEHGSDTVLDVEVTSNRGDCLSHIGVARELSALMGREFSDVTPKPLESATPVSDATSVSIEATDLCPHYTARVIRGVRIAPSPADFRRRLEAVGLRPVNNVVDVTNYVMFELGQPLHAFDLDKLTGGQIVVRKARAGESLTSIDGHERKLAADMLVIADTSKPVALAGVMGGRDSEVSDATVNVLLESARFDPLSVRKTARALQMRSDSSYRFERGIDPLLPERASRRAAELILEFGGGELLAGAAEAGASGYQPKKLTLRLSRFAKLLGTELPVDAVFIALQRLQLSPVAKGDTIEVTVPSHRLDLNIEVDLIEEAARVIGYDQVPLREEISIRLQPAQTDQTVMKQVTDTLVACGYFEAITFSFAGGPAVDAFRPKEARGAVDVRAGRTSASLRPSLIPGLLLAQETNQAVAQSQAKLFEIGSAFWYDGSGRIVERRRIGLVGSPELRETRGVVEAILRRLNRDRQIEVRPEPHPGFIAAASGGIYWDGLLVGFLGKVDRAAIAGRDRALPTAAELELPLLLNGARLVRQLTELPKFPAVARDLSFDLPEATRFEALENAVRKAQPDNLEELKYVTTYRGKQLEKDRKSVTITLVFRAATETLTGDMVEAAVQKVIDAAKGELGATLRA